MNPRQPGDRALQLFFSYSHKDEKLRVRLETHLESLRRQGLITAWHDRKIAPGTEWRRQIHQRLDSAEIILLLISADFIASEYCYDVEMNRALERHEAGEARVIPIVLRPSDWQDSRFGKLQALPPGGKPVTSWRDRDEAFTAIAQGLRDVVEEIRQQAKPVLASLIRPEGTTTRESDGRGRSAAEAPALPGGGERLVDEVFDVLARNPILLLLAQDGRAEREVLAEILERAAARHGAESTFHLTPPGGPEATPEQYFARLARQCGIAGEVRGATDWEDALDRRLSGGERFFLLVSGFEKGSAEGRRQLGAVLRTLSDCHGPALAVVLSGGEQLAALKYQDGRTSVLNAAERLDWPEPTADDVRVWQRRDFPGLTFGRRDAGELLELCGGHPRLVRFCLDPRRRGAPGSERAALADYDVVWQLFTPYQESAEAPQVCEWLWRDDLGREQRWIGDGLLRRLYWTGALANRAGRLVWRCNVVREVGRLVLGCG